MMHKNKNHKQDDSRQTRAECLYWGRGRFWDYLLIFTIGIVVFYIASCVPPAKKGLVVYKASNIKGYDNKPIIIDYDFVESMNRINAYAKRNNLTLHVTSSFRRENQKLSGTIVKPAKMSNHLVGHAIDMNIEYNGKLYDSKMMRKDNLKNLPENVRNFIDDIRRDRSLRWGGDFTVQDPVHIDDYLNRNNNAWLQKYYALQ